MLLDDYWDKLNAVLNCKTIEDIFTNPKLDPINDYNMIVTSIIVEELRAEFVLEMIKQGKTNIVIENICAIDINQNWKIAKDSLEFRQIFFENFEKALENSNDIYDYTLSGLEQVSVTNGENTIDGKALISDNWKKISKRTTNELSRLQLIKILNSNEKGIQIIKDELPTLFFGDYSYSYLIQDLLKENIVTKEEIANLIEKEPTRMLSENFEVDNFIFNSENFIKLLEQIDEILESTSSIKQNQNIRESIEKYLANNFEHLIERIKTSNEKLTKEEGYPIDKLKIIKKWDTDKHLIRGKFAEHYEEISTNTKKEDVMDLIHLYSDIDVKLEELDIETVMKQTFSNIKDKDLQWMISKIATELLEDQSLSIKDMEIYGRGNYSKSIKAGEYIFKIGNDRSVYEIPYDERIIYPLIRRKMKGEQGEEIYLEVQNLVDKEWYKGMSEEEIEEELYKIYAEMRERGHRWTDVRKDNVGRLKKPNLGNFEINGDKIIPSDTSVGFINEENKKKVLPAGELVIIDTDFVYQSDKAYSGSIASQHKKFEERYIRECAERDAKRKIEYPPMLVFSIELTKEKVSNKDIQEMSQSVMNRQKSENAKTYAENNPDHKEVEI